MITEKETIENLERFVTGGVTKEDIIVCADRLNPDGKVHHLWVQASPMSPLYPLCDREFKKKDRYSLLRNNYSSKGCCKYCKRIYDKLPKNKNEL